MLIIAALRRVGSGLWLLVLIPLVARAAVLHLDPAPVTRAGSRAPTTTIPGGPQPAPSLSAVPGAQADRRGPATRPPRVGLRRTAKRSAPIAAVAILRRVLNGFWLAALAGLVGLAIFTHLTTALVIRGGSMEPSIPLGSLVTIEPFSVAELQPGDVVTVAAENGVLITHRVTRIVDLDGQAFLELMGDANTSPAPLLTPASALKGRVTTVLPVAGYLAAMLDTPVGLVGLLAFLATVLVAVWLLEELEWSMEDAFQQRRAAARPERYPHADLA